MKPLYMFGLLSVLEDLRDAPSEDSLLRLEGVSWGFVRGLFYAELISSDVFDRLLVLSQNAAYHRRLELDGLRLEVIKSRPPVLPLPIVEEGGHFEWSH